MDERETMGEFNASLTPAEIAARQALNVLAIECPLEVAKDVQAKVLAWVAELRTLRSVEPPREMVERAWAWMEANTGLMEVQYTEALAVLLTAIRAEAIEECAKVADDQLVQPGTTAIDMRRRIATAIRSLSTKGAGT